jgi:hypothetical protein
MSKQANIPLYVKLVSSDHLGISDAREWYKVVLKNAPEGVVTHIDSLDLNGTPARTRMVRRSKGESTELIIPLMRDLLPTELETIANAWKQVSPVGSFTITTNPTQSQKLNQAVSGLEIPNDEYQTLCLQLAKVRHEGWIREKSAEGWGYGPVLSLKNKTHPLMRPWNDLPAQYRDVDSKNPEQFLTFLNNQGYAVVKQTELGALLKVLRDIN